MAENTARRTVYFKDTNSGIEMYAIDAHHAVTVHPKEYSFSPWDGSEGVDLPNGEPRAVVPNDWIDLKPSDKLTLARRLGAKDVRSGSAAEDFINSYLVERANAGVSPAVVDETGDDQKV